MLLLCASSKQKNIIKTCYFLFFMVSVEVMAPAGSWEALRTAIQAEADSVYFGVDKLNMRARAANNFELKDLKKVMTLLHKNGMKGYLTINIVVYDDELGEVKKVVKKAKEAGVDAIIASDFSVINCARDEGVRVHLSTQANVSNVDALKFYSEYVDAVVLARELSVERIKKINHEIKKQKIMGPSKELVKTEAFIHGALCVAVSGKCYMSLATYNHSANRGDCLQTCRRKYKVFDEETGQALIVDNEYVMSPSDLSTFGVLPLLLDAGVSIFKIEGRGRSPEYVFEVTRAYKEALDLIGSKEYDLEKAFVLQERLKKVFNRGFWENGYYLGSKVNEWSNTYGSRATHKKHLVGKVLNFYQKQKVASVLVESMPFEEGEELLIIGPTTGVVSLVCAEIKIDEESVKKAKKKDLVTIKVPGKVRKNDKVYVRRLVQG